MYRLLYCCLFLVAQAQAQSDPIQLAEEICHCIERGETDDRRARARRCFENLTGEVVEREQLLVVLAENCSFLRDMGTAEEPKVRWTDIRADQVGRRFTYGSSDKQPPPPPAAPPGESPTFASFSGTLEREPSNGKLVLLLPGGKRTAFELDGTLPRQDQWVVGDFLKVRYRREWRPGRQQIARIATEVLPGAIKP